jgi:L-asparaginase II
VTSPVVAEVVRSGLVESRHRGRFVALDSDGRRVLAAGAVDEPIYPRSALKPVQALAMLRAGWTPPDEPSLALACASHSGEDTHVAVVRRTLDAAGLDEAALDNTPDLPLDQHAARALLRAGGNPDRLHQNCSGKHAAMLATCVANGWPTATYRDPAHPLQVAIKAAVEDLAGEKVTHTGVDGCGAPLFALSLSGLAGAFRRLVLAEGGTPEQRVAAAMRAHPELVGGTGRDVTVLMRALPGLVVKDGAEGVMAAATAAGAAVTLKIDDGAARPRTPVLIAALRAVGLDVSGLPDQLTQPPVLGHGESVGEITVTSVTE